MAAFRFAFLVRFGRQLEPELSLGGAALGKMMIGSDRAMAELAEHLKPLTLKELEVAGSIPVVIVDVQADAEDQALVAGFRQATICIEPYSLIAHEGEGFDFSRSRPTVLPHALLIDDCGDEEEAHVHLRYIDGPRLLRLNVGADLVAKTRAFNTSVVREIGKLYPESLQHADRARTPLEARVARAIHWYAQAEGQPEITLAFVCYWIGLEALALKSSTSSNKRKTLVARMTAKVRDHDPKADWEESLERLWGKRSDVVHEGLGAVADGLVPDVDAGDLNMVKYLFFVALLYTLQARSDGVEFEDLWHPRPRIIMCHWWLCATTSFRASCSR